MNRSTGLKTFLMVMCLSTAVVPLARAGVNLDGVNDRLDIADHESFTHNPSNSYSWSFWVCPRNVNDDWKAAYCALIDINTVVGIYVGNASGIGNNAGVTCYLQVGSWDAFHNCRGTNANVLSNNTWHHVAVVWDTNAPIGYEWRIYVNGTDVTQAYTDYGGTETAMNPTNVCIGGSTLNETPDAVIAEFAYWHAALTAAEIAQLAGARVRRMPLQIQPSSLRLYLPLDDVGDGASGNGAVFRDLSGSGHHAIGNSGGGGLTGTAEEALSYP